MARQSLAEAVPVLLTRPEAEAQAFASALQTRFGGYVRPVIAPLMRPRFLYPKMPEGDFAGVIFTSAQGVEAAAHLGVALPRAAYCVGRKTAAAAASAGYQAHSADGDANSLVSAILADRPTGRLLYIHGVDTRGEIEKKLNKEGVTVVSLQAYIQDQMPLTAEALAILQSKVDVVLPIFSPRSAVLLVKALPTDTPANLWIAAMSPAVAEASQPLRYSALVVASTPNAQAMLDAVGSLLSASSAP
jgi:uroporphyrinogen-III synthase